MTLVNGPVRVLVTGFGPFPGIRHNASEALVRMLAEAPPIPGVILSTAIIPVAWSDARAVLLGAIAKEKPGAVLHFGVSKRSSGFVIETCAHNECCTREDAEGRRAASEKLARPGKATLRTSLPALALLECLRAAALPAAISKNAGRYLCNAVYYWSLAESLSADFSAVFVHIPAFGGESCPPSAPSMRRAAQGAKILIQVSAAAMLEGCHGLRRNYRPNMRCLEERAGVNEMRILAGNARRFV